MNVLKIFLQQLLVSLFNNAYPMIAPFGTIEYTVLISTKGGKTINPYGFIKFKEESSGIKAITEMNKKNVLGKEIIVNKAYTEMSSPNTTLFIKVKLQTHF